MEQPSAPQPSIDSIVERLCSLDDIRHVCPSRRHEGAPLLSNTSVRRIVALASGLMFPGFFNENVESASVMRSTMTLACHELRGLLIHQITA
ncbi:MAG: hypothetical protein K2J52_03005 [Duncaniella sp.]|nr:hypothetical protein [Duncaniella sp.]